MPQHTNRLTSLPPYVLAAIPQKKRELLARGVDVIDLGAGDADLAPPPAAVEALAAAAREPAMNRYGFGLGLPAFRDAVSAWMHTRFEHVFDPLQEIIPLIGSKEGLAHLALAYVQSGDATIIPEPGYNAYRGGTLLSDGDAYLYPITPRTKFLVELDDVPADVLARTKMLYLNYPNNPTGAIAPMEYLERVVKRCRELDIVLVYDNPYSEMTFDGYVAPSIFDVAGARDVAIEFHSLSKTYNMTGWRCGWACGNREIVAALAKVKSFLDTGQFMAVQRAGIAALESWKSWVPGNIAVFKERRDAAVKAFRANGFTCEAPKGTMYLWLPLPDGLPSADFADRLLEEQGVIVLPGSGLGAGGEGFFRVSFITSPERIAEAAVRAGKVLASVRSTLVPPRALSPESRSAGSPARAAARGPDGSTE
jgi:LL-diaminopimelate aminotransferase